MKNKILVAVALTAVFGMGSALAVLESQSALPRVQGSQILQGSQSGSQGAIGQQCPDYVSGQAGHKSCGGTFILNKDRAGSGGVFVGHPATAVSSVGDDGRDTK